MREKLALIAALIPALLGIKKALDALAIISIYKEGMAVAASGGDISPYIVAMVGVLVAVALPVGLLQELADA
jgi:hypothetical protein